MCIAHTRSGESSYFSKQREAVDPNRYAICWFRGGSGEDAWLTCFLHDAHARSLYLLELCVNADFIFWVRLKSIEAMPVYSSSHGGFLCLCVYVKSKTKCMWDGNNDTAFRQLVTSKMHNRNSVCHTTIYFICSIVSPGKIFCIFTELLLKITFNMDKSKAYYFKITKSILYWKKNYDHTILCACVLTHLLQWTLT